MKASVAAFPIKLPKSASRRPSTGRCRTTLPMIFWYGIGAISAASLASPFVMSWLSSVGYAMFPLTDAGKEIATFPEIMHIAVTVLVVLLSIVSLTLLIIAGVKNKEVRSTGICAAIALAMMMIGAIGQGVVPPQYFGIVERFSVFAAVGFTAVLGWQLFAGMFETGR